LKRMAGGAKLLTLHHPDAPWRKIRGLQSRGGQRSKNRKGGRPRRAKSKIELKFDDLLRRLNGRITVRQLMRSISAFRHSADDARAFLFAHNMVCEIVHTKGCTRHEFVMLKCDT
jgi:hypothetical protein